MVKTVIRLLLSKYGYLSVEMQNAFADEMGNEEAVDAEAVEIKDQSQVLALEGTVQTIEGADNGNGDAPAPAAPY